MKPITFALLIALSVAPAPFAAGLEDAARLLPTGATALVGIDVASIKDSVLYSRFEQQMEADKRAELDEFARQTGLDPRTDLDRVTVAMWGPKDKESLLLVAQGRAQLNLEAQAFIDGFSQVGSHHGIPIYEGRDKNEEREMHYSFIDDATLIAGTPVAVVEGIERHVSGGVSAYDDDALMVQAADAQSDGQLWLVSRQAGSILSRAPAMPGVGDPRLLRILSAIEETTFSLNIINGMRLTLASVCASAVEAQTLAAAARGMLAIARLGAASENDMLSMLDKVQVTDQDSTFEAALVLTASQLDEWIQLFESSGSGSAD